MTPPPNWFGRSPAGNSHQQPALTMPEELLLFCTDAEKDGRIRQPLHFNRVLAGAVLTDLLLAGLITVDAKKITGFQPFGAVDPIGAQVLDELGRTEKRDRLMKLQRWIRVVDRLCPHLDAHYLGLMVDRGLATVDRARMFGFFPYTRHTAVDPGWGKQLAFRMQQSVQSSTYEFKGPAPAPAVARDLHESALLCAIGMQRRLYPGRDQNALRHQVAALTKRQPIAAAVRVVIVADKNPGGDS